MVDEGVLDISLFIVGTIFFCCTPLGKKIGKHLSTGENDRRLEAAYRFDPEQTLGSARLGTIEELKAAGYLKRGGIRLGYTPDGSKPLFYNGFGHILMVAAARAGKLFTVLVATILSLGKRSLYCVDPKAELVCVTGHARKRSGKVIVINPFRIHLDRMKGLTQGTINVLDMLHPDSPAFMSECDKLAESFRPQQGSSVDPHWWESSSKAISGTIAAVKKYAHPEDRHLISVRAAITGANGRSYNDFCRECMKCPDLHIRERLAAFAAPGAEESRERQGVLATMDTQTAWLGNEAIASILKTSNFHPSDLKRHAGMSLFNCLPLNHMDTCFPLFQLITMAVLWGLLDEGITGPSVLAIIDEAAQIPWFKAWQDAWGMAAGAAGLQILAVYQSWSQIVTQMGSAAMNVVQNAGVKVFFGCNDPETRDLVSRLSGTTSVITHSHSVTPDPRNPRAMPTVTGGGSQTSRPLLYPEEVYSQLGDDEMWMFAERVPGVVKAKRRPYLKEFSGQYRDNPYVPKKSFLSSLFK
jgi:type IV secretion system protein VirD4